MEYVDKKFISLFGKIDRKYKIVFLSTIIAGIFAHGIALFNKFSVFDDLTHMFTYGVTLPGGRWMLEILRKFDLLIYGSSNFSLPLFNGLVSIILIAISSCLMVKILDINNIVLCSLIGILMVIFPTITSLFGFMFTSKPYMYGILFGVIGVYYVCCYKNLPKYLLGLFLLAGCVAVYQAYIPFCICLALLYLIKYSYNNDNINEIIKKILFVGFSFILFMLLYFALNSLINKIFSVELVAYKGLENFGLCSFSEYINRIVIAYKDFIYPAFSLARAYPSSIRIMYFVVLLLIGILFCVMIIKVFNENRIKSLIITILFAFVPLAVNFVFVMVDMSFDITMLMEYSRIFVFILLILMLDMLKTEKKIIENISIVLLVIISFVYVKFDNICYLRTEIVQQEAISYFTTLVTRIKSVEGYKDEYPVSFVYTNKNAKDDLSLTKIEQFDYIYMDPYFSLKQYLNKYSWQRFVGIWCGYSPTIIETDEYLEKDEIKSMNCYPDDGSIKIVDDIVFIKFN